MHPERKIAPINCGIFFWLRVKIQERIYPTNGVINRKVITVFDLRFRFVCVFVNTTPVVLSSLPLPALPSLPPPSLRYPRTGARIIGINYSNVINQSFVFLSPMKSNHEPELCGIFGKIFLSIEPTFISNWTFTSELAAVSLSNLN